MSRVNHFEIPAYEPERAISFYAKVFDWKFEKWDGPVDYWLIMTGPEDEPGIDGGLARRADPATRVKYSISVESVDEAVDKIVACGGKILRPKSAIQGVGWLAYCQDTEGNNFEVMEVDTKAK